MQEYSIIIIGGGISGLYLANKLKLKGEDIHLFERKPRLGGRIKSITQHNITYDSGALRISKYHKKVLTLIKQLHLENQLSNFNPKINYYINNKFSKHNKEYLKIFNKLKYLNNNTKFNYSFMGLAQLYFPNSLIETSIAKIGYYTDAEYLNGYQYLAESKLFDSEFFRLDGGLSQIINKLAVKIGKENISLKSELNSIEFKNNNFIVKINNKKFKCKKIILAIPPKSLLGINYLSPYKSVLNSVRSNKYIRVYAIYPKVNGKVWFDNISTIHTDLLIKKIIPIDKKTGLIMVAYTDGIFAEILSQMNVNQKLKFIIQKNLKQLFPNKNIPNPIYFKAHFWDAGTHWWNPGISPYELIPKISQLDPTKKMYIAGEAYSDQQGWIEGALTSCDLIIKMINKNKKVKTFTTKQVAKHNKETDAWVIYNDKVYDITHWLKKHPGGSVINIGLGKDITKIFRGVNHSDYATSLLENYFIGFHKN